MSFNLDSLFIEWRSKVPNGVPNVKNAYHLSLLKEICLNKGIDSKIVDNVILVLENDDEKYQSVGRGYYKLKKDIGPDGKGKEGTPTFEKDDTGNYVEMGGEDGEDKVDKSTSIAGDEISTDSFATKALTSKEDDDIKKSDDENQPEEKSKQRVESVTKEIYGDNGDGPLLQNSETSQQALDNGYVKKKPWVAPGNAGSNYNENMSNEGALILEKYPNLSVDELAQILHNRTKNTKLGKQQKDSAIKSEDRLKVPKEIKNKFNYKAAVIAARSAKSKHDRAKEGQEKVGLKNAQMKSFGGTATDLNNLKEEINKGKDPVLLYDDGRVFKIPKENILKWVDASGGGENAADTVVLSVGDDGTILFDGWSDKKSLADIQGNSTLNDDFKKSVSNVKKLLEDGKIDKETANQALSILTTSQKEVADIEKGYSNVVESEAQWMNSISGEEEQELLDAVIEQGKDYEEAGTKNHWENFKNKIGAENDKEALEELVSRGATGQPKKLTNDEKKIVQRLAKKFRDKYNERGDELPQLLDTNKLLSQTREKALNAQRQVIEDLNKFNVKTKSGQEKPMGDMLAFEEAIEFLHLDKIDQPKDDDDYSQILRRNTQLVMEGISVEPDTIKDCLGVEDISDAQDNFEVLQKERLTYDRETGTRVTGKVVYIYAVSKGGEQTEIGQKTYRSKDGPTGKTNNTIEWSGDMQKCFDSKREK